MGFFDVIGKVLEGVDKVAGDTAAQLSKNIQKYDKYNSYELKQMLYDNSRTHSLDSCAMIAIDKILRDRGDK